MPEPYDWPYIEPAQQDDEPPYEEDDDHDEEEFEYDREWEDNEVD